jgi:phosphoserine phosphatase
MESALTTRPPVRAASSSASRDLPLAVGPAIRTTFVAVASVGSVIVVPMADLVATLIAPPGNGSKLAAGVEMLSGFLDAANVAELAREEAVDIRFQPTKKLDELRPRLHQLIAGLPVDVIVQPTTGRKKRLLIADMDSTIIGQECIDELADFAGLKPRIAAITDRAMRGEVEFEPALRERVALLKGLPIETIDRVLAERIRLTKGAKTLVATMRANGAQTILVSGGFTAFVEPVAAMAAFNESRANRLLQASGRLTGGVAEPVLGRNAKLATLEDAIIRLGISAEDALAVGDGANDLGMISRAGLGVAFHAKPKVAEAADARIDHADLTALLFAQGYRRAEFLTS